MEEGTIAKWHKKVGDHIASGELLLEVATDKANVEYNALDEGYLRKILVEEGQSAIVNQPIAVFTEQADEKIDDYQPEGTAPSTPEEKSSVKEEPKEEKKEGSMQKVSENKNSPGIQEPGFSPEPPLENSQYAFLSERAKEGGKASPLAKKIAKEKGIDISQVKGSGPSGRVTSRDLDKDLPNLPAHFGKKGSPKVAAGSFEEEALTPMRKAISERLQQAKSFIPHIYLRQTIDAEPLVSFREQLKNGGLKVTFNDLVIRGCALALREHPEVNVGFDSVKKAIVRFQTIDISVAVTLEGGLITPIVRFADFKNLSEISLEVKELAVRAKLGKLQPHEYRGGSFTVSNLGMFGISDFSAIINPPQAAILAVSGIEDAPVVKNGSVVAGKTMNITLSVDHRVLDGTQAAKFLKTVQKYLENPALLAL